VFEATVDYQDLLVGKPLTPEIAEFQRHLSAAADIQRGKPDRQQSV